MDPIRARMRRLFQFFRRSERPAGKTSGPYRSPGERPPEERSDLEAAAPPPARPYRLIMVGAVVLTVATVFGAVRLENSEPTLATIADAAPSAVEDSSAPADAAPAPPPCTDAELRALIDEGKKGIAKRKYDDARAALDKALACREDDAEALSERGLAWYLSGEMENADEDLALASRKTKKPGLLGTIWYRRGLVDEKEFGETDAKPAFVTSYWIGHHEGAKQKVGSNACGSTFSRFHSAALGDVARTYASGEKLVATLTDEGHSEMTGLGSDEMPGKRFPDVLRIFNGRSDEDWLIARGKTAHWAFQLANRTLANGCRGETSFVLSREGNVVHAHGYFSLGITREIPGIPDEHACFIGPVTGVDAFFRPDREVAIIVRRALPGRFDEREDVPAPTATLGKNGVTVKGLGCNDVETWDEPLDAGIEGGLSDAEVTGADAGPVRDGSTRVDDAGP